MGLFGGYEWDAQKARANLRKHGVEFADAVERRRYRERPR